MIRSTLHSRRDALKTLGAVALMSMNNPTASQTPATIIKRKVPTSGELVPVLGLGTWQVFDVAPGTPAMAELKEVMKMFVAGGGSVVDSSPMYGRAEAAVGEVATDTGVQAKLFIATKV